MSLVKFNNRNRLFPWNNASLKDLLSTDTFFNDDFFTEDGLMPAMNIKEHETDFEIEFAAPGFSKEDFEVSIEDNVLFVKGEKKLEREENEKDFMRREFNYSAFNRSIKLPTTANLEEEIKATYKKGILNLRINKLEASKTAPKKLIEVN
ncbi:Hsp20/alpha crystallin family protein [Paucihalobacter ruber]|uniref:Hsp20/alpha crystallin family protein n=1 Tax=Paucihalobacter ruber TaxID=2567861 RepID=A0A506PJY9_9FLAO|nr:Hsp20/alpha crystallin family protein [Paucihalobacter ruber]TPV33412.1 Hsp20/alpha crystallin family protein [Paucihalobacter ruber]